MSADNRNLRCEPTSVVALKRCVAVAEVQGPEAALGLLAELHLDGYHLFHAPHAELLRRRLGQHAHRPLRGKVPHHPSWLIPSPSALGRARGSVTGGGRHGAGFEMRSQSWALWQTADRRRQSSMNLGGP